MNRHLFIYLFIYKLYFTKDGSKLSTRNDTKTRLKTVLQIKVVKKLSTLQYNLSSGKQIQQVVKVI